MINICCYYYFYCWRKFFFNDCNSGEHLTYIIMYLFIYFSSYGYYLGVFN